MFDFAILAGMVFFVRLVLVDSESSDMVDWSLEGIVRSLDGIVIGPSNGIAVWSSEGIAVETYNAPIPMDTASIAMMTVFLFIL